MFNKEHILYMVISGVATAALLFWAGRLAKTEKSKNKILKFFAIITVVIHYSNLWVDYFAFGGEATVENNHILPVYPCNAVMLGEFCFWVGTVCGVIGIVLNVNFDNTPTLADYDVLKGMLSHSTMLFGCLYMRTGGFIRIRTFNAVSVASGLGVFVLCGMVVNKLYEHFGMEAPDGMFLKSNPYMPVSPIVLGVVAVALLFIGLSIWELRLPKEERWYSKLKLRN